MYGVYMEYCLYLKYSTYYSTPTDTNRQRGRLWWSVHAQGRMCPIPKVDPLQFGFQLDMVRLAPSLFEQASMWVSNDANQILVKNVADLRLQVD